MEEWSITWTLTRPDTQIYQTFLVGLNKNHIFFPPQDSEDIEYKLDRYCQPRNSLLLLISNFVMKCSAKLAEINKKDRQEKAVELLDNKCYMKMVEIAHSLLKMAPYDQECIKSKGLQMYMTQVFP